MPRGPVATLTPNRSGGDEHERKRHAPAPPRCRRPAGVAVAELAKSLRRALRRATLAHMELHLPPETEIKLNDLAQRTHRGTDELIQEAVDHLVTYNEWLERKVKDSQAAVERGETVSDGQVRAWLEGRERS
jgi:predicted transcriptional regulator